MKYVTADPHFCHDEIRIYCDRPFSTYKEMNNVIISRYNEILTNDDTLYIVGDFGLTDNFNQLKSITNKIRGRKILILGNHDNFKPFTYISMGFESVHTSLDIGSAILVHDPAVATVDSSRKFICGHVHRLFKAIGNVVNVGVDVWDYYPITIEKALSEINMEDE